jgi:DNA-binding XRE family transcriptional regulator
MPENAMLLKNAGAIGGLRHHQHYVLRALLWRHAMTDRAPRPDPALQLLGATIRQYRKPQRLSQKALAAQTGLSSTYIGEIELGWRNPTALSLLRIAKALHMSAGLLLQPLETQADTQSTAQE